MGKPRRRRHEPPARPGQRARILQVGRIVRRNGRLQPVDWEFDSLHRVPAFEIVAGVPLWGGYSIEALEAIAAARYPK